MKKTIITVVGHDTVGIIAKVCAYLANNKINILDISQTIIDGYFNMMMIVDASQSSKSTSELVNELGQIGEEIGVVIRCQHEDIFNKMHRI
ncbi:MAG: ACT domain-containing protein [Lachnospiraceae bacterium]|jgi:ACT domain-containing protein|nr:ACT domain-containing protein [Lachnospiraceae bacterium]